MLSCKLTCCLDFEQDLIRLGLAALINVVSNCAIITKLIQILFILLVLYTNWKLCNSVRVHVVLNNNTEAFIALKLFIPCYISLMPAKRRQKLCSRMLSSRKLLPDIFDDIRQALEF